MSSAKEREANQGLKDVEDTDQLPSYAEASAASVADAESSTSGAASAATAATTITSTTTTTTTTTSTAAESPGGFLASKGPTVASPFNFPSQEDSPPSYSAHEDRPVHKPIAIPQARPEAGAPFVAAYAPVLLGHGIPAGSWRAFLETVSAFLQARVSERAVAHAADVARDLSSVPRRIGKELATHAKAVGKEIGGYARKGNLFGATLATVGGTVALTIGATFGLIGVSIRMPSSAFAAVSRRPQTPRDRAAAYLAVANRDWFRPRGLDVSLLDTAQLAELVDVRPASAIVQTAALGGAKGGGADGQLRVLSTTISPLEVEPSATLEVGIKTLWLVITQETKAKQ